jgi:tetratricopeptide (TPR) repeat protein
MRNFYLILIALLLFYSCNYQREAPKDKLIPLPVIDQNFYQNNITALNKIIKNDPKNDNVYFLRAKILMHLGRNKEALEDLKTAVKLNDQNPEYYHAISGLYLKENNWNEAYAAADRSRKLGNRSPLVDYILAETAVKEKRYEEALDLINAALSADTSLYRGYAIKGEAYCGKGDTLKAAKEYETAFLKGYQEKHIIQRLAYLQNHAKNSGLASKYYSLAVSRFPGDADVYVDKGKFYYARFVNDSAAYYFNRSLRLDSANYQIHFLLGNTRNRMKNYAGAAASYKNALKFKSDFFDAQYKLALSLENAKELGASVSEFQKAFEMDTTNLEVKAGFERVKRRKKYLEELDKYNKRKEQLVLPEIKKD